MKNIILGIFIVLVLIIPFFDLWKYKNRYKTGETVEGIVAVGNLNISWNYIVNGKMYKGKISKSRYPYIINDEKYKIYYSAKKPSESSISFTEPVIDSVSYKMVYSEKIKEKYNKGSKVVSFSYKIEGKQYDRKHRYKFVTDFIGNGEVYKVYYLEDEPSVSYINFNK